MKQQSLETTPQPCAEVRREAAVWIARIHSPERTALVEAGLRRWLKESPDHQRAFELANELWDTASRIPDGALPRMMRWKRVVQSPSVTLPRLAAALSTAAALIVIVTVAVLYGRDSALTTDIGEQRAVTLTDGTRVSLNTDTRLVVQYDDKVRRVQLNSGEALFDVSQNALRPFIVIAGDRSIEALGTSFVVRRDERQLAVTLVEGKVAVRAAPQLGSSAPSTSVDPGIVTLAPGERVIFPVNVAAPTRDHPKLEKLTAWQRGLVALDYTPLSDAAAEMNRYSAVKIVIDNPQAASARISGVFRAGESLSFAQAIAKTYQLNVAEESSRIVISGIPLASQ